MGILRKLGAVLLKIAGWVLLGYIVLVLLAVAVIAAVVAVVLYPLSKGHLHDDFPATEDPNGITTVCGYPSV